MLCSGLFTTRALSALTRVARCGCSCHCHRGHRCGRRGGCGGRSCCCCCCGGGCCGGGCCGGGCCGGGCCGSGCCCGGGCVVVVASGAAAVAAVLLDVASAAVHTATAVVVAARRRRQLLLRWRRRWRWWRRRWRWQRWRRFRKRPRCWWLMRAGAPHPAPLYGSRRATFWPSPPAARSLKAANIALRSNTKRSARAASAALVQGMGQVCAMPSSKHPQYLL